MTAFGPALRSLGLRCVLASILASALVLPSFLPSYAQAGADDEEFDFGGMFTEVSGSYVDEQAGIEIEFPDGWSGLGLGVVAIVVPGGIKADEASSAEVAMMVMALPRAEFSNAFSSLEMFNEQVEEDAADQDCRIETYAYTKINSIDGIHIVAECSADEGYSYVSMYGVMSENNFILIALAAESSDSYNEHLEAFEQSVNTLQIDHPIPFKTAMVQSMNLKTMNHQVVVKGAGVDLKVQTNSQVSDLAFSEPDRRISVRVEGQDGTDGMIIIAVDEVLGGPYTVTIDGQTTTSFVVAEDDATGQKSVEISYHHSVHDIAVTGASVVPEFPPAAIASILGVIGVLAVLTRIKMIGRG